MKSTIEINRGNFGAEVLKTSRPMVGVVSRQAILSKLEGRTVKVGEQEKNETNF